MTAAWVYDDPAIPDNEVLLRKVKRLPTFRVPNLSTNEFGIGNGALQFDEDGLSVYRDSVRESLGVPRAEMCDWEKYTVIEFPAAATRQVEEVGDERLGGVIPDPVDDPPLGAAHALVRTRVQGDRAQKGNLRAAIRARAQWIQEDPRGPHAPNLS